MKLRVVPPKRSVLVAEYEMAKVPSGHAPPSSQPLNSGIEARKALPFWKTATAWPVRTCRPMIARQLTTTCSRRLSLSPAAALSGSEA